MFIHSAFCLPIFPIYKFFFFSKPIDDAYDSTFFFFIIFEECKNKIFMSAELFT